MNLLQHFIGYLESLKNPASKNTLKNYKADIAQFIHWYESLESSPFEPQKVTDSHLERYQQARQNSGNNSGGISNRSLERHLSSLRKFFHFLKLEGKVRKSPFEKSLTPQTEPEDKWNLKSFKNYLYIYNSADLTIKNYIIDLNQFFKWAEQLLPTATAWNIQDKNVLNYVNSGLVNEYKKRLLEIGLSPLTINRRLSAIRRYTKWAVESGLMKQELQTDQVPENVDIQTTKPIQKEIFDETFVQENVLDSDSPKEFLYSSFPPFRLIQKTIRGLDFFLEKTVIASLDSLVDTLDYKLWILRGKPIFKSVGMSQVDTVPKIKDPLSSFFALPVKNIEKTLYAPLEVSTRYFPLHKKLLFYLNHKRPNWYKNYHSYPVSHYIHFAVLMVYVSALGFGFYNTFFQDSKLKALLAAPSAPPRLLSFEGRLTDSTDTPINSEKSLKFAIYTSEAASGSAMLWQEEQQITPDFDGVFSVLLGTRTPLTQSIFADNSSLWLGVSVDGDPELQPRQQLATVAFATNSELLQGMPPITQQGAGTKNVVLNLDSSGNLNIKGAPTFQAIGGQFKLSGKELLLTTNAGTNSNVIINPDGTGVIDFQKPVINSTNTSNITGIPGAVEIADMLAILATSSGQSALTINQNSTGSIISASGSGIAKFTVDSDGEGYFAGDLRINSATSGAKLTIETTDEPHIKMTYLGNAYATMRVSKDGDLNIDSRGNDLSIPTRTTIGSSTLGQAKLTVTGKEEGKALVILDETGNQAILTASASGTTRFVVQNGGNVGIGTANPGQELEVNGDIRLDLNGSATTNGLCHSETDTTDEELVDCSSTPGDIAEWYAATKWVDAGELVDLTDTVFEYEAEGSDPKTGKVKSLGRQKIQIADKSRGTGKLLGIVSTGPFQVFGEDIKQAIEKSNNQTLKPVPIALAGRVPAKVSLENGPIQFGDFLTPSSIPGIAMKATEPGPVIGMALESFDESQGYVCGERKFCGKVLTFIKNTWYDPNVFAKYSQVQFDEPSKGETLNDKAIALRNGVDEISQTTIIDLDTQIIIAKDFATKNLKVTEALIDSITTSLLTTQTLLATSRIESPVGEIETLQTKIISPLSDDPRIAIAVEKDTINFIDPKASSSAKASFDNQGNAQFAGDLKANGATFSGTLSSSELTIGKDATISGTLRAKKIIAEEIEGLNTVNSTSSATYVTNVTNIYQTNASQSAIPSSTPSASPSPIPTNTPQTLIASDTADEFDLDEFKTYTDSFVPIDAIEAQFGTFRDGIMAFGPSTLADLSVRGEFKVNNKFSIANNSINVFGDTLEIQPFRQGGVSILAGKVVINTDGTVNFSENATFAKDIEVHGAVKTSVIKPIPDHDLVIALDGKEATQSQQVIVTNASGSAVLTIDDLGTLTSSSSGTFADIFAKTFKIVREAQADTSVTETVATASAGIATIKAGYTFRTIITPHVKEESLIYISPTSDTSGVTPYIANQVPFDRKEETQPSPSGSFTVRIPKAVQKDINLNWWIVN